MDLPKKQWQRIANYIPKPKAQPGKSGRSPQDCHAVLNGILTNLENDPACALAAGIKAATAHVRGLFPATPWPLAKESIPVETILINITAFSRSHKTCFDQKSKVLKIV